MKWIVMDVRDLQVPDALIDIAIDKGTLDTMIHGSLWDLPDDVRSNVGNTSMRSAYFKFFNA